MSWSAPNCAVFVMFLAAGPAMGTWIDSEPAAPIPESELLDIGIQPFDPGLAGKWGFLVDQERMEPQVRQAEASFLAIHLMRTLQATQQFGLVRMVPANSLTADLMISGRILDSTGRRLELEIRVLDATGRRWFKKKYKLSAEPLSYAIRFMGTSEPFQLIYDNIALDLIDRQRKFKKEYLTDLRAISKLRYAAELAPAIFGKYLKEKSRDRVALARLPSRDDPMLARIGRLETHNEFFLDLLTERYDNFYREMDNTYDEYRANSYDVETALIDAISRYHAASRPRFVDPGDFGDSSFWKSRQAGYFRRRVEAQSRYLDEISLNFAFVIEPIVIDLDGETLRLEGSIEDQYAQWQELLERIFESETGLPAVSDPVLRASNVSSQQ